MDNFIDKSFSEVISTVFEHCILDRYVIYFRTSDNLVGFEKEHGYSHAIYTLRCMVDSYSASGLTIGLHMCALHLTKAFDKTIATDNLRSKFVVSISTHYGYMKDDTKCRKWGGLG